MTLWPDHKDLNSRSCAIVYIDYMKKVDMKIFKKMQND